MPPRPIQIGGGRYTPARSTIGTSPKALPLEHFLVEQLKTPFKNGEWYVGSKVANWLPDFIKSHFEITHCTLYGARVISQSLLLYAAQFPKDSATAKISIEHAQKIAAMGPSASFKDKDNHIDYNKNIPMYLTEKLGWSAYYWSRDIYHKQLHNFGDVKKYYDYHFEYKNIKKQQKDYHSGVKISGIFVNFAPRPVKYASGTVITMPAANADSLAAFKKINFAWGYYRGGYHNQMLHRGKFYEAHWAGASIDGVSLPKIAGAGGPSHSSSTVEEYWDKTAAGVIITPNGAAATKFNSAPLDFFELMKQYNIPQNMHDQVAQTL